MSPRRFPLLLAPFLLLVAFYILASCVPNAGPGTSVPATPLPPTGGDAGSGGGVATASVITIAPAGTTLPGVIPNSTVAPFPTPEPPTPIPPLPSASLSPTELKYRLLARFPDFFFCDPDYYPVARADEAQLAAQRFPEVQANTEEFQAILSHLGLTGLTSFTDAQKLQVYREYKRLNALHLQLAGDAYRFQVLTGGQGKQGLSIQGTIDGSGRIDVQQQTPAFATCPICLAAHTRIDTPHGPVLVEDIRPGNVVWTLDGSGKRFAAPVLKVARVPVSAGHILVHVVLADGRELWASPGHPTADGRVLADLRPGDVLDGSRVVSADQVPYNGGATYDVLPAGLTGYYWADGILMGSTLHP